MSLEPTFKKPKCPESPAFTLYRIDDILESAIKYINDKKNNQILNYFQLKSRTENAIGAPNPNEISKQYTPQIRQP